LPAVLRDPALGAGHLAAVLHYSLEARGRARDVRLDRSALRPALARHLAGAERAVPASLSVVLLAPRIGRRRARHLWRASAGGRLRRARPHRDALLLRPLPDPAAAARQVRAASAFAGQHQRGGAEARAGARRQSGARLMRALALATGIGLALLAG